jgi:hypothetical protein
MSTFGMGKCNFKRSCLFCCVYVCAYCIGFKRVLETTTAKVTTDIINAPKPSERQALLRLVRFRLRRILGLIVVLGLIVLGLIVLGLLILGLLILGLLILGLLILGLILGLLILGLLVRLTRGEKGEPFGKNTLVSPTE